MDATMMVPDLTPAANIKLNKGFELSLGVEPVCLSREAKILTRRSGIHIPPDGSTVSTSHYANTRKLNCRLVGHPAEAGLGQCLAPLDGVHPAENNYRKAGVRQGLAPARWTKLDLQAVRRVRKPPLKTML